MRYSEESKRNAVRRVISGDMQADVARDMGVSPSVASGWARQLLPALGTTDDLVYGSASSNMPALLDEAVAGALYEYLLYGAHALRSDDPDDDSLDADDPLTIHLPNGDVIDCEELAQEALDAIRRFLDGEPVLQSIQTSEEDA